MAFNTTTIEPNRVLPEDWSAIGRFQCGDDSAFDGLLRRHWAVANTFADKLTKDREEAADIVAESFYRIFRSLHRFRGDSSFTSWLYRIEFNCFLDIRKKAVARQTVSLDDSIGKLGWQVSMNLADDSETAHEQIERRERIGEIERAMKCLPPTQKQAFMMYQADAMSYEDISIKLCVPIGTVKSRLNRARLHMRKTLTLQRGQMGKYPTD